MYRRKVAMIYVWVAFILAIAHPAFAELELSVYGGASFTPKIDMTVTLPQSSISIPNINVDNAITGGVKIGYWFGKSSAAAVGFGLDDFIVNRRLIDKLFHRQPMCRGSRFKTRAR